MPSTPDADDLDLLEPFEQKYTRPEASDYGQEVYNVHTTPRSFEGLPIPYVVVRGRALYAKGDLDHYFRSLLKNAARRIGKPLKPPQSRPVLPRPPGALDGGPTAGPRPTRPSDQHNAARGF